MEKKEKVMLMLYATNLIQILVMGATSNNQGFTIMSIFITSLLYMESRKKKDKKDNIIIFLALIILQSFSIGITSEQYIYTILISVVSVILIFLNRNKSNINRNS